MAETYKKLAQGQLATSVGRLYLCPGSTTTIVRHIRLVNTDTDIHSVTMHHIDSGVTPSGATNILNAVNLAAGGWAETVCCGGDGFVPGLCLVCSAG